MFVRALIGLSISVAASLSLATSAVAQSAAQTSGGDVTADEATPLPPVVVSAPKERARKPAVRQSSPSASGSATSGPTPSAEQIASEGGAGGDFPAGPVGIFTLGQLDLIGGSTITNEAMWTYNKQSVDKALSILPGVTTHSAGGSRNERDIFVRGFDRQRVPLYMDGVRITLPYDNRLDFSRFLTPDLAEIQVQKGYVSVLNGPGGMGGAINLVSRKPTKEFEAEGRSGAVFDGNLGSLGQWSSYAYAGTRQRGYYAQISGNIVDQDHFDMSNDFTPATAGPGKGYEPSLFDYEDGGNRDHSGFQDWRINAKAGITPNATDEYSINYTTQKSEKEAPLHTDRQIVQGYTLPATGPVPPLGTVRRFWDWPQWDISTLSWLSKTQIGDASYVKTNAYYNTFENVVTFYRDKDYTSKRQDSPYDDHSAGGFVEVGTNLIPMNTLKGAIHYRRDAHWDQGINYNLNNTFYSYESAKEVKEETWSYAVENTFHATKRIDLVAGVSYDTNEVLRSDGTRYALPELEKWNWQGAAIYSYGGEGKLYANVSSRTRFPTMFDRYSSRFGARTEQPNLGAERATNYEIGWSDTFFRSIRLSSSVFYSDIEDSIQTSFLRANQNTSLAVYNADGDSHGFEASGDWDVTRSLKVGGNYTYLERDIDFRNANFISLPGQTQLTGPERDAVFASQVEGTPRHEVFLYAAWKPVSKLTLTPSMEIASDRTALVTSCSSTLVAALGTPGAVTPSPANGSCGKTAAQVPSQTRPNYIDIGAHAVLNIQAEYDVTDNATVAIGVTNLTDQNYSFAEGFPEPGRQFYATARAKF